MTVVFPRANLDVDAHSSWCWMPQSWRLCILTPISWCWHVARPGALGVGGVPRCKLKGRQGRGFGEPRIPVGVLRQAFVLGPHDGFPTSTVLTIFDVMAAFLFLHFVTFQLQGIQAAAPCAALIISHELFISGQGNGQHSHGPRQFQRHGELEALWAGRKWVIWARSDVRWHLRIIRTFISTQVYLNSFLSTAAHAEWTDLKGCWKRMLRGQAVVNGQHTQTWSWESQWPFLWSVYLWLMDTMSSPNLVNWLCYDRFCSPGTFRVWQVQGFVNHKSHVRWPVTLFKNVLYVARLYNVLAKKNAMTKKWGKDGKVLFQGKKWKWMLGFVSSWKAILVSLSVLLSMAVSPRHLRSLPHSKAKREANERYTASQGA